jgi:hypothetical protein
MSYQACCYSGWPVGGSFLFAEALHLNRILQKIWGHAGVLYVPGVALSATFQGCNSPHNDSWYAVLIFISPSANGPLSNFLCSLCAPKLPLCCLTIPVLPFMRIWSL